MLPTQRDDPWGPFHPERLILKVAFWSAVILFAICLAINIVSLFGYDLTQLVHTPWSKMEGSDPEVAFVSPIGCAFVILLIPLVFRLGRLGWRQDRLVQDFSAAPSWLKFAGGFLWLYVVATLIYVGIAFHFGGPQIHNGVGTIWLKGEGRYELVSPQAYHHAVAIMMVFISAWGMTGFAFLAIAYLGWLQNTASSRIATEQPALL